jgi:hypothetical protein
MSVLELIEMLSKYNEGAEVFVELNHDEIVKLNKMPIEMEMTVDGNVVAFEEDEKSKSVVVIQVI